MLQLADPYIQNGIESLYLQVTDGEPVSAEKFTRGLEFLRAQRAAGRRTLIACGAGISRSTIFAMAALMDAEQRDLFDAYKEVYQQHSGAQPHHALVMSLAEYHGDTLSLMDVWDGLRQVQKQDQGV